MVNWKNAINVFLNSGISQTADAVVKRATRIFVRVALFALFSDYLDCVSVNFEEIDAFSQTADVKYYLFIVCGVDGDLRSDSVIEPER